MRIIIGKEILSHRNEENEITEKVSKILYELGENMPENLVNKVFFRLQNLIENEKED